MSEGAYSEYLFNIMRIVPIYCPFSTDSILDNLSVYPASTIYIHTSAYYFILIHYHVWSTSTPIGHWPCCCSSTNPQPSSSRSVSGFWRTTVLDSISIHMFRTFGTLLSDTLGFVVGASCKCYRRICCRCWCSCQWCGLGIILPPDTRQGVSIPYASGLLPVFNPSSSSSDRFQSHA